MSGILRASDGSASPPRGIGCFFFQAEAGLRYYKVTGVQTCALPIWILQRVMQELQANIKNVDVVPPSDAGHFVLLKDKKLLAKYTPAGVDAFPAGFKDRDGYY